MKEIDAATLRASLPSLTADRCRENAAESMITSERLFDEGDSASALYWQQNATTWATLALSCEPPPTVLDEAIARRAARQAPPPENPIAHECCHNSQRLPGARLYAAGDPEPQVNPGTLYADPAGVGQRYLLRVDGIGDAEWLWCDSLADAEAHLDDAVTWARALGCGIIRVREATEREQIEFRNGTGGAALDLVRRLLTSLANVAHKRNRPDVGEWLAACDAAAHTAIHTWQWPLLDEREPTSAEELTAARVEPEGHPLVSVGTVHSDVAQLNDAYLDRVLTAGATVYQSRHGYWPTLTPGAAGTLMVRVENPEEDLKRLTPDTLARLRDQITTILLQHEQAGTENERWRAGTGGGAAQWREG